MDELGQNWTIRAKCTKLDKIGHLQFGQLRQNKTNCSQKLRNDRNDIVCKSEKKLKIGKNRPIFGTFPNPPDSIHLGRTIRDAHLPSSQFRASLVLNAK